ncbi:hypothetical protein [Trichothermofontia sp.]
MNSPIVTKILDEINALPTDLQQQVLTFAINLRQHHQQPPVDAWDVLESLTGTLEAPSDWSAEHDHYLYGTPKYQETDE